MPANMTVLGRLDPLLVGDTPPYSGLALPSSAANTTPADTTLSDATYTLAAATAASVPSSVAVTAAVLGGLALAAVLAGFGRRWRSHRETDGVARARVGAALADGTQTERMRAARTLAGELAETSQRYRSLFDHNPHAVCSLAPDGSFTAANAACERIGGFTPTEMLSMNFADIVHPDDLARAVESFTLSMSGLPQDFEGTIFHKAGHSLDLQLTALPIVIDGQVVGVHSIAQDVTQRLRLQAELNEAHAVAEEANKAKTVFLANVSHEIRTPLTRILAGTELMSDIDLPEPATKLLDNVSRASRRLLRLVDDLLDHTALTVGGTQLRPTTFDLRAFIAEVMGPVRVTAHERGLTCNLHIDPRVPTTFTADQGRLQQVMTNLLENALKFTQEGSVGLGVAPGGPSDAPETIVFTVTDTGIGMSRDALDRLYEPFVQGDPSMTRPYGGAGLGLAICRDMVDLMGGTLTATSAPGTGSSFTVGVTSSRMPPRTQASEFQPDQCATP